MKKLLFITLLPISIFIIVYLLFINGDTSTMNEGEKQLYTCGMHPQIISEEPGLCPICEMNLTPIKKNGKSTEKKIVYWRSSMNPNEIYDKPGKDQMGMDLVPVYESDSDAGVVAIDPVVVQNMNVKSYIVNEKELSSIIKTNGVLVINESAEYKVTTRIDGWVEKLYLNYTGQQVNEGDKLMEIYSPELVSAQQELLTAVSYREKMTSASSKIISDSNEEILANAKKKLLLYGLSDGEIERIIKSKEVKTNITLYAKKKGTVLEKNIVEGEKIQAGMPLLKISDLSSLWLLADVYEYELDKIFNGAKAEVIFNFLPNKKYSAMLSFIYPTIDEKSRTVKLRFNINNNGELKPAMFASVVIDGKRSSKKPIIPESAVIRSGDKNIVIISLGDGKFKPQEVELGIQTDGFVQVLQGLSANMQVVTSAQFLIDSESNLREAISKFQNGSHDHSNLEDKKKEPKKEVKKDPAKNVTREKPKEKHDHNLPHAYEGVIDVESIDANKDGKLWECPMDWNILADSSGRCPVCNMKLKEYSLDQIKENLMKHGYQHK